MNEFEVISEFWNEALETTVKYIIRLARGFPENRSWKGLKYPPCQGKTYSHGICNADVWFPLSIT